MLAAFPSWQLTAGWGWPVPVALAAVLLIAAPLFGLVVERVIIRPVEGLGEAERLVVTVALLSGLIAVAQWIWNPNIARTLPAFFAGAAAIHIGPASCAGRSSGWRRPSCRCSWGGPTPRRSWEGCGPCR